MPRKKEKHTHRLKRHKYNNGTIVYFCTLDCNFKIDPKLAIGKLSVCNRCGEPFYLTEYSITLKEPHCGKCHGRNKIISNSIPEERREIPDRRAIPDRRDILPEGVKANSVMDRMKNLGGNVRYETIPSPSESIDDDLL